MSETILEHAAIHSREPRTRIRLKLGIVLLAVSLSLGWVQFNLFSYPTFALGGRWGNIQETSSGLQVSTIINQFADFAAYPWSAQVKTVVNLAYMMFGIAALIGALKDGKNLLKCSSFLLLLTLIVELALVFAKGSFLSHWFEATTEFFYVNFGQVPLAAAVALFLSESSKIASRPEALVEPTDSYPPAIVSVFSKVVHCHTCPMREVCKEGDVEASYELKRLGRKSPEEAHYAVMQRITLNCPLKKSIEG
ncbi:MAG: hypothetical protein NWF14_05360 [Candidatus Bathyarchaeota archaeon]|nr:hypothetical protein [Candidatus Bathyarchaeota archaeon]